VLAEQAAPVEEYHQTARQTEVDAEAAEQAAEELAASNAAGAIKNYVAWPPKQRPFDGTPKRPVPGECMAPLSAPLSWLAIRYISNRGLMCVCLTLVMAAGALLRYFDTEEGLTALENGIPAVEAPQSAPAQHLPAHASPGSPLVKGSGVYVAPAASLSDNPPPPAEPDAPSSRSSAARNRVGAQRGGGSPTPGNSKMRSIRDLPQSPSPPMDSAQVHMRSFVQTGKAAAWLVFALFLHIV
jgi:hypothetical protein